MIQGRKGLARLALAACAAAFALATAPSAAMALNFDVNSTADTGDASLGNNVCANSSGFCTLRAAIQEAASTDPGNPDTISFDQTGGLFDGTNANSTIALTSVLLVQSNLTINGENCGTMAAPKPCVALNADDGSEPFGHTGILIFGNIASSTVVSSLAIYDAQTAIASSTPIGQAAPNDLLFTGLWLGMDLDQSTGTTFDFMNNEGLSLLTNSSDVGGDTPVERNVFAANQDTAINMPGGDNNTVSGNYFGTNASGTAILGGRGGVQIYSLEDFGDEVATNNVIGGPEGGVAGVCDDRCNLFALPQLVGESQIDFVPPGSFLLAGATRIEGNHIGFNLAGAEVTSQGIGADVGGGDDITVGGDLNSEGNVIGGGEIGVNAGTEADRLLVQNNLIGVPPDGSGEAAPSVAGAVIDADNPDLTDVPDRPIISNNSFAGDSTAGQDGLRLTGSRGTVSANSFGRDGTTAAQPFGADAVEITGELYELSGGNQIHNGRAAGINIDGGDFNTIKANTIEDNGAAAAGPGVRIQNDADFNVVGGDPVGNPTDVNTYINNAGDAIEVLGDGSDSNLLLGNLANGNDSATGSGAGDLMIDLGGDGLGNVMATGPNEGVAAPMVTTATTTTASGTAASGAPVMVYTNSGSETGAPQPAQVLGQTLANAGGSWTVTYAAIPDTQFVFANQSPNEGSSELAGPVDVTVPSSGTPPPPATTTPGPTGQRAAALKKCKKKKTAAKRKKCRKKARLLPL